MKGEGGLNGGGGAVVGDTTFKGRKDRKPMRSRFGYLYPRCLPMRRNPLQGKRRHLKTVAISFFLRVAFSLD
jgi:hypothetical protein